MRALSLSVGRVALVDRLEVEALGRGSWRPRAQFAVLSIKTFFPGPGVMSPHA